jgi:hypothetical protein
MTDIMERLVLMEISLPKRNETTLAVKFMVFYKYGITKLRIYREEDGSLNQQ